MTLCCEDILTAASKNHIPCVENFRSEGYLLTVDLLKVASIQGYNKLVKYLVSRRCPWNEYVMAWAAARGHVKVMRTLFKRGCPWNSSTTTCAAENGHLDALRFAHLNGCSWTPDVAVAAMTNNWFDCLLYYSVHESLPATLEVLDPAHPFYDRLRAVHSHTPRWLKITLNSLE